MAINYFDLFWAVFNLAILLGIGFGIYKIIKGSIMFVHNSQVMDKKLDLILAKLSDGGKHPEKSFPAAGVNKE